MLRTRHLAVFAAGLAAAASAQVATPGIAPGAAPAPYSPAGVTPGQATPGVAPGSAVTPALPQVPTGITPPVGATTAGTIGDGRVGTLAPGASSPGVTGQRGLPTTSGISSTTPTTNPTPR